MKQKLFLLLCSALLYIPADAQNGWLPPVTFPNNTGMCKFWILDYGFWIF